MSLRSPDRRQRATQPLTIDVTATARKTDPADKSAEARPADDVAARLASEVEAARRRATFANRPDLKDEAPPSWSARFSVLGIRFARRHASTVAALALAIGAGTLAGRMLPQQAAMPVTARPAPDLDALRGSLASLESKAATLAAATDVQALERRVVSLRETLERTRTETVAGLAQLNARDTSASLAQLSVQVGRMEDALREIATRLEAAEQRASLAPVTTGSITPRSAAEASAQSDSGTTVQGKTADARTVETRTASAAPDRPVLSGWLVHDVRRGIALVEGPAGLMEVSKGQSVPGLGKVEAIERRGRGWIVLTSRGMLEPAPW